MNLLKNSRTTPMSICCPTKAGENTTFSQEIFVFSCSNTIRIKELFSEMMRFLQITFTHRI